MTPRLASVRPASVIEILEARVAPASLITATYAAGKLTVTGDGEDGALFLFNEGTDAINLHGGADTLIALNGEPAVRDAYVYGPLNAFSANMGAGNDTVFLTGIHVAGDVTFEGGEGNDLYGHSATSIDGKLTVHGGAGDDSIFIGGGSSRVAGATLIDLGEGTNSVTVSADQALFAGPLTIIGGSGADTVAFPGPDTIFPFSGSEFLALKGVTANLGAGDNAFSITTRSVRIIGALSVTHLDHSGTATTSVAPISALAITGAVTITYGSGASTTRISADAAVEIGGAVQVLSNGDSDTFDFIAGGIGKVKRGFQIHLGNGDNAVGFAGVSLETKSIAFTGGTGADSFQMGATSSRVGAVTISPGEGPSLVTFSGYAVHISGLVKIIAGSGDDTVELSATDLRLAKGVQFLGGDGANTLTIAGGTFHGGPITVEHGEHASGISSVLFASTSTTILGALKVTGKGGDESVTVASEAFAAGEVSLVLGGGANSVSTLGFSTRIRSLNITGGSGVDTINFGSAEFTMGTMKANLGDGANFMATTGGALVVERSLAITTGNGDDTVSIAHLKQRFGKGAQLFLGDGLNAADFTADLIEASRISSFGGAHQAGTSTVVIAGNALEVTGAINVAFAGGDSRLQVTSSLARVGAVKYLGSSANDSMDLGLRGHIGSISFVGGNGNNRFSGGLLYSSTGPISYVGGTGDDVFGLSFGLGTIGSVTGKLGSGNASVELGGGGQVTITGATKLETLNLAGETATIRITDGILFRGATTIRSGAGDDSLSIAPGVFARALRIDAGAGNDIVDLRAVLARGAVSIILGAGDDSLQIGHSSKTLPVEFAGVAKFDGGAGADTAHVSNVNFGNIYVSGQPVLLGFETED